MSSRSVKIITALLSLFVILLIAVPAYWYKAVTASAGLENTVASQLSNQLGRHVEVEAVHVKPTGRIIVTGVTVEDQGQVLLRTQEMTVVYNVFYIFSANPLAGLRSIDFLQPEMFVDRYDETGEWNIIQFIKDFKKPDQPGGFRAVIRIVDGKVLVKAQQQSAVVDNVNGEIDFTGSPHLSLRLKGLLAGEPLSVKGTVHTYHNTFGLQIEAQHQVLETLALWYPQPELTITQGTADISVFLLQEQYQPLQYSGEVDLKDVSAALPQNGYQLSNITGKVLINNSALFLQGLTGKLNGELIGVQGNVALDGKSPYFDISITAQELHVQKALPDKTIPVEGNVQAELSAVGNIENIRVHGVVRMKQGMINGIALHDGIATVTYKNGWIDVHDLQAGVLGGSVQGQGAVKLGETPVYTAILQLDGVQSPVPEVTGKITANVFVTGNEINPLSMVWGAGKLEKGAIFNVPYDKAETGFYWLNNQLQLDYFNLATGSGWILVNGSGSRENLNFTLQGENFPLDRLTPAIGNVDISGIGMIKGTIQGTVDEPSVTGAFEAKQGQVLQQSFALCSGEFFLTKKELALRNVIAVHNDTQHNVNGSINLTPEPALNLHIVSKNVPAVEAVKLLGSNEKITGRIDNEMVIQGPLKKLSFAGRMFLKYGEYREQHIDQAQINYVYHDGILELKDSTAVSGSASLELSGTLGAQQELDFRFAVRNIRFEELIGLQHLPYEVTGRAEFSGTIKGIWDNPRILSSVKAYDTSINKQSFGNLNAQLEFIDKQLIVPELTLMDGTACYKFLGKLDFNEPPQIEGELTVREGQVAQLLGLLSIPIPDAQGKVTADLILSGLLSKPDARGQLTVAQGHVKGYPVEKIELDVVAEKGIITLNALELTQGQGFMRAQGTWAMNDVLALEIGGKNLDAGFVAALLPNPQPVKGTINFTAQIAGTTQNPQAAVSVEIKQGTWANAEFDSLYALALLENDIVKLNQIMLIKGPHRASAYGTVPLEALSKKGREEPTSPTGMDIIVQLEQADLSILPLLSKDVVSAAGQTHGQVRIGGNLYQPFIFGQFTVTDGSVKFRGFNNPVEHANIKLKFDGDQIRLETFNGQMGGGTYAGNGSALLKGFSLSDLNLSLNLDKLYVNSKYFIGTVDGALVLEEARGMPLLKGGLNIVNAEINPPVFWPDEYNALPNVRLDVEIQVDKNVRLRNTALYDMYIKGKVKAQGTLKHPVTSGRINVVRGNLQYLSTPFIIKEGIADFNQYDSFLPSIRILAQTRIVDTKVHLQASGPLTQMDFQLTSEPSLSQQQIITLLTLRSRSTGTSGGTEAGGGEQKDQLLVLLNEGLQFTFVQRVEKVFENFLGVDEFHIVRSQNEKVTDKEMYNLEVGKYVSDKIFLGYTLGIDQTERTFRFRYDITNRISLEGELDDQNNRRYGVEARFYF